MKGNYFYDMIPAEELAQLPYMPTVAEFTGWLERYADRPALAEDGVTCTYAQMLHNVACRRTMLNGLGLKKGAKVAIMDRNTRDAIEMFLAVTSAGYVAINLPASLPEPAVVGSCKRFDVEALMVGDEFKPLCNNLEGVKVCPVSGMADEPSPVAEVDKDDIAAIFFTGGTTGAPKGAVLSHHALMRGSFNGIFKPGSALSGDVYVSILPLSHVFGLIRGTMSCFYTGALIHTGRDMKALIGRLPQIRPTCLVLVPGLCDMLYGLTRLYGTQFLGGRLTTIIAGAANVPPRLVSIFAEQNIRVLGGYGLTEGANLTSGNADTDTRPSSVGQVYPGQETKIVDGELWLRGDNIFEGYYKDPVNTETALTPDGWLRTGDLVRFDEDGFLYIVGRIKNLIILSNGENVSPETIEEPFYRSPAVKDCLVKEMDMNDEKVIGIEILPQPAAFEGKAQSDIEAFMNKLVAEVNATLPTYCQITKVVVRTEDFKRTGSMKVART